MRSSENQQYLSMLEWGHMKINNILVYWNEVTWESITNQYGGYVIGSHVTSSQHTDVLFILMWPYSSIIKCYWFSCDLITSYWGFVDSHGFSFHHINVLLILMMRISNTLVCWDEVIWESIKQYVGMRSHENQQYLSMLE
jgi:hypothetical protein